MIARISFTLLILLVSLGCSATATETEPNIASTLQILPSQTSMPTLTLTETPTTTPTEIAVPTVVASPTEAPTPELTKVIETALEVMDRCSISKDEKFGSEIRTCTLDQVRAAMADPAYDERVEQYVEAALAGGLRPYSKNYFPKAADMSEGRATSFPQSGRFDVVVTGPVVRIKDDILNGSLIQTVDALARAVSLENTQTVMNFRNDLSVLYFQPGVVVTDQGIYKVMLTLGPEYNGVINKRLQPGTSTDWKSVALVNKNEEQLPQSGEVVTVDCPIEVDSLKYATEQYVTLWIKSAQRKMFIQNENFRVGDDPEVAFAQDLLDRLRSRTFTETEQLFLLGVDTIYIHQ